MLQEPQEETVPYSTVVSLAGIHRAMSLTRRRTLAARRTAKFAGWPADILAGNNACRSTSDTLALLAAPCFTKAVAAAHQ